MSPRDAGLWVAKVYLEGFEPFKGVPSNEIGLETTNTGELEEVRRKIRRLWADSHDGKWPVNDTRLPAETLRPKVMLPTVDYAPDILNASGLYLLSARLRYAMALPDAAVQYVPIEPIDGSDLAYQQDYRWMAYLQSLPVLDLEKSEFELGMAMPGVSPEDQMIGDVKRVVIRDDFLPTTPLFRIYRRESIMLATEALARRVERAGCTGLAFWEVEPELAYGFKLKRRLRERSTI